MEPPPATTRPTVEVPEAEEPPPAPLDWSVTSAKVGGGEPDDAFLVELLGVFMRDGSRHLSTILAAARDHKARRGGTAPPGGDDVGAAQPRDESTHAAEAVFKAAHALKGSSASVGLMQLSEAARAVELPCRAALAPAAAADARDEAMDTLCAPPAQLLADLASTYRATCAFIDTDVAAKAARLPSLKDETRADLAAASLACFDAAFARPLAALVAGEAESEAGVAVQGTAPKEAVAAHADAPAAPPQTPAVAPAQPQPQATAQPTAQTPATTQPRRLVPPAGPCCVVS